MSNNEHGLANQQARQGALYFRFVFYIERSGGFVQQHNGGILQQSTRDRNALPFTARKLCAVFANRRVVALRQLAHKLVAVSRRSRRQHLFVACALLTQADIGHDRIVEQGNVLEYHRVVAQEHFGVDTGNVYTAHFNSAFRGVPQACSQASTGTFARTARTYERRHFTFLGGKVHATQHLFVVVSKAHVLKDDVMACGLKGACPFCNGRVVNTHKTVGRNLGQEHFGNHNQALVKGCIDTCNDQQKQEECHEFNLARQNEISSHQNGRCYPQAHNNARTIDKKAGN